MIHKFLALNFNNSGAFLKRNSGELLYLLSQYSVPTVAFFVNFLIMKYVGPETIGSYQAVILWGSYFSFLQLGVFNGLNRNLAYYKGANRTDDLQKATSTGFLFSLGVSVISLFVVFFIATTSINDGSETVLLAFIFLGVSALMQPVITFFDTLYRTGQDFRRLGKFNLIENGVFLLSSGMMMIWGYAGFVIQNIVKLIVGFSLRYFGKIKTISITFDLKVLMVQINTGFPILLNSYLYSTFFIFDQFYIVRNFSALELGYYNIARLVSFIIPIIPNSLTTVFYPKASLAFGKSGDNTAVLKSFFLKALAINIIVILPMVIIIYFLIEPLILFFLPEYSNGINYAKLSVLGGIGYIMIGPSVILGVLKKNKINFIALSIMSLASYGLYTLGILNFYSIESLIWFKNIIFICYAFFMLIFIYFGLLKK